LVVDLCHGGSGGFVVDDGGVVGVGRDEGLDGQVVDRSGEASGCFVDAVDGVVGEEGVGSSG
jgi:hypothetical protein